MTSSGPVFRSAVTIFIIGVSLLLGAQAATAADRVNAMTTYRQGSIQPWQVRPGVSLPVFGNATDAGSMPGDGSAVGETYNFSFSSNPNVLVTHDGSLTGTVTNDKYIVENVTFELLNGSTREVVAVTLTVDDGAGSVDSETREIDIVDPADPISDTPLENLSIEVNIAIQDGLRYLYLAQQSNGRWRHERSNAFDCGTTGFTLWAFANSGHQPTNDYDEDIYAEFVQKGVDYVLSQANTPSFSSQPYIGNPDADGNGRIINLCPASNSGYATPIAASGIIAAYSSAPSTLVASGAFAGETYAQVIQDVIDWSAFGQQDGGGSARGGWRYSPNGGADTSVDSWHYVANEGLEAVFGGTVLELVKQEAERRINSSQSQGGAGDRGQFGYGNASPAGYDGNATTAGGLSGLVMVSAGGRLAPLLDGGPLSSSVFPDVASRKAAAAAHLGLRWNANPGTWAGNRGNFYAMWTTARALRLSGTAELVDKDGVTFNWETGEDVTNPGVLPPANSVHEGYFTYLVRTQAANGSWVATVNGGSWTRALNSAWGVLILQPTVFGPPPPGDEPPVALCQDPSLLTLFGTCSADSGVDAGSFDPEGGALTYVQEPPGPYGPGMTDVLLTVTDESDFSATCEAVVTVTDAEPPMVTCNAPAVISGVAGATYSFTATSEDNCDPGGEVSVAVSSAVCEDDDGDDDGVPDDQDECPGSDTSEEVVIDECITGVINVLFPSGCTIMDLILACGTEVENHGEWVSCVAHLTNELKEEGIITGREKGVIQKCAAQAQIPPWHPGGGNNLGSVARKEACEVTSEGGTVSFPSGPNSGYLTWTVTATDSSGNSTSETCTVVIQDEDTPLPNLPPTADAGDSQVVASGTTVQLDGSGSTDLNGDVLTYQWTLATPGGSAAALSDATAVAPTFTADVPGTYTAELVVSDGTLSSDPDAAGVAALNQAPMASAGPDQESYAGDPVTFDGSGSTDPEGASLAYFWTLAYQPAGSTATLDEASAVAPTLTPDVRGTYVVQLAVSDGELLSTVDAAILRAINRPPVANAGPDQEISVFDTVTLDGSGSFDGDGDPITYLWAFISKPAGSAAALSDATSVTPTFYADLAGVYELELVVNDGSDDSAPDAVSILTVNTPPVANAGPDQTAFLDDTVQLDGTGSFDVDGDGLTYTWSFLARPSGSAATLSDATSATPTFVPDVRGIYQVQLVVGDGQRLSQPDTVTVTVVNRAPVADAGADQTAFLGDTVTLDGSGSFDDDGDPLTYSWSFVSRPAGSSAVLSNPSSVSPTFVSDARGNFVVRLVVNDGFASSAADTVTITVPNRAPVANAGPDQTAFVTDTVTLDGSGSTDADGDPLTYSWSFVSRPAGSSATLSDPSAIQPTFEVDVFGTYVVELVVDDGDLASAPDTVTIDTLNSPPVANAGADQEALPGDTVFLDGSGSYDVDGDSLTYSWSFLAVPPGSTATLSDPTAVNPSFVIDEVGAYLLELIVNDGTADSAPDTVSIATGNVAPVADAGADQTGFVGDIILLDGSGSLDANGDPITYSWSFVSVPDGSLAVLSGATAVAPSFQIDVFGTYVAQLVVSDGEFTSDPDTVTVTTLNSRPVADAGPDQLVGIGWTAFLDGSGSSDADGDPLTYAWSLTTVPAGSTATLSDPTVANPFFVADELGTYVAQLIVDDGDLASVPDTVMIEATDQVATVPDVVGLSQASAESEILAAELAVGEVTEEYSFTVPEGLVIRQEPPAGTAVLKGSPVDVAISLGPTTDVAPPQVTLVAVPEIVGIGETVYFTVTATDDVGIASVTLTVNGSPLALDAAGETTYEPVAPGLLTAVAEAVDLIGRTASDTEFVSVRSSADNGPPLAALTAPAADSILEEKTNLVGTASDSDLVFYDLEARADGTTGAFASFYRGFTSVTSGVLAQLDPRTFLAGAYQVRVCAEDSWGNRACSSPRRYEMASTAPLPGALHLAFLDGYVDVAGLPIVVRRVYDARYKVPGDFGVGWRLETDEIKLEVPRLIGEDWEMRKTGTLIPTYSLVESASHRVSVYLPDGSVHRFRPRPQPESQVLYPIQYLNEIYWEALPGTSSTLSDNDVPFFVNPAAVGPVEIIDDNFYVFNPSAYTLTRSTGFRYTFARNGGPTVRTYHLTTIQDPNGNTVTFSSGGITHSAGAGVSLTRDVEGRITAITDPNGQIRTYTYDAAGDLVASTDFEGISTQYLYDDRHNLIQVIDPRGNIPGTLIYDDLGRIVGMIDADGNQVDVVHDDAANQEIVTDRLGNTTIVTYDDRGNRISVLDALGNETTFTYDADDNLTSVTDPLGNTRTLTYDADGNVLSRTDPLGNTTTNTYDADGNLTSITDPLGHVTSFEIDASGNETAIVSPRGGRLEKSYRSDGTLMGFTDPEGGSTTFSRDSTGRMTGYSDPLGRASTISSRSDGQIASEQFTVGGQTVRYEYTYDANSNLTGVLLPNGGSATVQHDETGLPVGATNALGDSQSLTLDSRGEMDSFVDYNGGVTAVERDAEGQVVGVTRPGGQRYERTLDALGRPVYLKTPSGQVMAATYDEAGRMTTQSRSGQGTTTMSYDDAGRLTSATAADGGTTLYEYDAMAQLTALTNPLGERTEFTYDPDGNLTQTLLPDGNTVSTEHDLLSRITAVEDERGARLEFTYDVGGQLTAALDAAGGTTAYTYDEMGNVTSATTPGTNTWSFTYDVFGNRTSQTFPWGGTETLTIDNGGGISEIVAATGETTLFEYDAMGSLTRRELASGEVETRSYNGDRQLASVSDPSGSTTYAYSPSNRVRRVDYPDGSFVEYEYDVSDRLSVLRTPGGETTYGYDAAGRLTSVSDTQVGSASYSYDLAGRAEMAVLPDGSTTMFGRNTRGWATQVLTVASDGVTVLRDEMRDYDAAGNPVHIAELGRSVDYTYDTAGRLVSEVRTGADAASDSYAYDADWNLTQMGSRTLTYDGTMRLTGDGVFTSYTYDAAGRPTARSNGTVSEQMSYDSLGRLVQVTRTGALPAQVDVEYNHANLIRRIVADGVGRNLLWDVTTAIPRLLEERDDAGVLLRRYVWGVGPVGIYDGAGNALALHIDMQGSVRLITSAASGSVVQSYAFAGYGEQTVGAGDGTSPLKYTGELFVPELGMYYLRARFYDPAAGRFLTPDVLAPNERQPMTFNPYLYANANPVTFSDPQGTFSLGSVSVSLAVVNILVSIALPHFESPVLMIARALGLTQATGQVGVSLAFSVSKGYLTGGLQLDFLYGPNAIQAVFWIFAGGQLGTGRGDPRVASPTVTFWVGSIYGEANSDPGEPRAGVYIMFTGTLAHTLFKYAGKGTRNTPVSPSYSRGAAALQFEILGIDKTGNIGSSFFQAFTYYGSDWGNIPLPSTKLKFLERKGYFKLVGLGKTKMYRGKLAGSAGISLTVYLPLIWVTWTDNGFEFDWWFG